MANIDEIYGGAYLNASLVKSLNLIGKPLTIVRVDVQSIGREVVRKKVVLSFQEIDKQLVLNKTNAGIIASCYGNDYETWVGRKIFLQLTKRQFQGQIVDAVSVACVEST